jgi:hypothetical protein
MLARSALFVSLLASLPASSLLTSRAQAAAFDDLKGYLASCLRFEMSDPAAPRGVPQSAKVHRALDRCSDDVDRLERADGRRLRGDGGISPSTKAVIQGVLGRGGGIRTVGY